MQERGLIDGHNNGCQSSLVGEVCIGSGKLVIGQSDSRDEGHRFQLIGVAVVSDSRVEHSV